MQPTKLIQWLGCIYECSIEPLCELLQIWLPYPMLYLDMLIQYYVNQITQP